MNFTKENIRYCLLSFARWEPRHIAEYVNDEITLTGLFNWSVLFGGKRLYPKTPEELCEFNLLHINITPNNLLLLPSLFKMISLISPNDRPKILCNIDYAIEMWSQHFTHPATLFYFLEKVDYVFSVEDTMSSLLTFILKRNVPCIPHPCDVKSISKLRLTNRKQSIGAFHHVYDNNFLLPSILLNELISKHPSYQSSAIGGVLVEESMGHLYNNFIPHQKNFKKFLLHLRNYYAILESYTIHSYGRSTIECAALGIPVVGSSCVSSQRKCFPELSTKTNDFIDSFNLLDRLISEPDFYTKCAHSGIVNCNYYSFDNCSKMMLDFLNSST